MYKKEAHTGVRIINCKMADQYLHLLDSNTKCNFSCNRDADFGATEKHTLKCGGQLGI